jgi:t-SNARE complex subunit (syntaxin)
MTQLGMTQLGTPDLDLDLDSSEARARRIKRTLIWVGLVTLVVAAVVVMAVLAVHPGPTGGGG